MKPTKQKLEQKIQEILSYLLCHNMADMDNRELSSLTNELYRLEIQLDNMGIKKGEGSHLDGLIFMK